MIDREPITIECTTCGHVTQVKFLRPGDIFKCRECGTENKVPDSDYVGAGPTDTFSAIAKNMKPSRALTERERVARALWLVGGGLVLFVFGVGYIMGTAELRSSLLARLLIVIGLIRLRDFTPGKLFYIALAAVSIGLAMDASALLGLHILLSFLPGVELLLVVLVLYRLAGRQNIADRVRIWMWTCLVTASVYALLSLLMFRSAPFLAFAMDTLQSLLGETSAARIILGTWLPNVVLGWISTVVAVILTARLIFLLKGADERDQEPHSDEKPDL